MCSEGTSLSSRSICYLVATNVLSGGQPLCYSFRGAAVGNDQSCVNTWGQLPMIWKLDLGEYHLLLAAFSCRSWTGAWKYNSTGILSCWRRQFLSVQAFWWTNSLQQTLWVSCSSNLFVFKKVKKRKLNTSVSKSKHNTSLAYRTDQRCTNTVRNKCCFSHTP